MTNPLPETPASLSEAQAALTSSLREMWLQTVAYLPVIVIGIILLLITWGFASLVTRVLRKVLIQRHLRGSLIELICRLASIGMWIFGLLITATVVFPGFTIATALGGLGLFSIAVGFAFKDTFENFFAGMLMLWKFPFENGDYIECEQISGEVLHIDMRQTLIRQTSDEVLVVPNGFLFRNPVNILTYKTKRRLSIMTGVAYGENLAESCKIIEQAVHTCMTVDKLHPIQIYAHGFGESSMDIEVTWWTDPKPGDLRKSRSEVVIAVKEALDAAGIEIPFPYRTLTFKEPLPMQNIPIKNESLASA